jgi:tripartite ATP-independent transporter DctP family solute receptor
MRSLKFLIAGAVLMASTSLSMAATQLRFAHQAPPTDLQQDAAEFFKAQVEEKTAGEITVAIFPQGQLGGDQQMIDGLQSGIVDVGMTSEAVFTGNMPELNVLALPYIFESREHAYKVLDGDIGQGMLKRFEEFRMKGLAWPENGFRNMTNDRGPIRTPADVAGLKMRTNTSKVLNDTFAALGANPQPITVSELYTALETGVVDAQEHPINITHSYRYDEVQDYLSITEHAYSPLVIVMNLNKFNSLPPQQQAIIQQAATDAAAHQRQLSIDKEASFLSELEERGMEINRDVDKAAFQAAVKPVWDGYISQFGDEVVTAIQAAAP